VSCHFSLHGQQAEVRLMTYPAIYYDLNGFRTEYSILFDEHPHQVLIWHWDERDSDKVPPPVVAPAAAQGLLGVVRA
jgi:hypothetical protein